MWDKICKACGGKFEAKAKNTRFCPSCAEARKKESQKKCIRKKYLSREPSTKLVEEICATYKRLGEISPVSVTLSVDRGTVRRVLVNAGLYSSPISVKVRKMFVAGKTIDQISADLEKSKSTIIGYLPYFQGMYSGDNKTKNAIRLKNGKKIKSKSADTTCPTMGRNQNRRKPWISKPRGWPPG